MLKNHLPNLGPGILMATAAVGGSHLVASTQAGALFGWQLLSILIFVNILKYPFFKFAVVYTIEENKSLIEGYKAHSKALFFFFIALNLVAAVVNTAAVLLLTAILLQYALPFDIAVSSLCILLLFVCLLILLLGHYKALDKVSKLIMVILTLFTLIAFIIAVVNGPAHPSPKVETSPYNLAFLGFMVALIGWMPAPIEISAINSLWLKAKSNSTIFTKSNALFDFKIGYGLTLALAIVFLSLGALLQYGQNQPIELAGIAFSKQLIDMYTATIGEWSRWLIACVAFFCMFGTTITVLDGYARSLHESFRLIVTLPKFSLSIILIVQAFLGLMITLFFKGNLKDMLLFAMSLSFISTPFFAWLNYDLIRKNYFKAESLLVKCITFAGFSLMLTVSLLFVYWQLI